MQRTLLRYGLLAKSLLRVPTYLLLLMYMFVGFLAGLTETGPNVIVSIDPVETVLYLILGAAAIAYWYINGTALNDYADYEIDKINLKGDHDRPLVVGAAKRHEVLRIAILCAGFALAVSVALSFKSLLLMAALLVLNISYSIRPLQISRRGGLAPLLLPMGYIILPFFLGFSLFSDTLSRPSLLLVLALYLHFLGRIILKDYRDVKGDKAHGKRTFLLTHGNGVVALVSAVAILASSGLTLYVVQPYTRYFQYPIIFFTFFGIAILYKLSQTNTWKKQKPLLAAFGRAMTGVTAATILSLTAHLWTLSANKEFFTALALMLVYLWSAKEAFIYNQQRLR